MRCYIYMSILLFCITKLLWHSFSIISFPPLPFPWPLHPCSFFTFSFSRRGSGQGFQGPTLERLWIPQWPSDLSENVSGMWGVTECLPHKWGQSQIDCLDIITMTLFLTEGWCSVKTSRLWQEGSSWVPLLWTSLLHTRLANCGHRWWLSLHPRGPGAPFGPMQDFLLPGCLQPQMQQQSWTNWRANWAGD